MIDNRILVRWEDVENDTLRLRMSLADERKQRVQADKEKKGIELELETLTAALFEEANQMVSAARKDARTERDAVDRRNDQLQAQLNDSELLLASHQEQLAELKQAMQEMSAHRHDLETVANNSTAPPTPALDTHDQISKDFGALHLSPTTPGAENVRPAPPTNFSHLISPVLRTDVQAFEDFHALLDISRRSGPPSRVTSGNYSTFSGLGLSNLTRTEQSNVAGRMPSNGSTSSLSVSNAHNSTPGTPNLPPSTNTSISSRDGPVVGTSLKETVFYKRVLAEDIEPTLRLDTAPGLSWLARRGVISSMCDGKMIVEPVPTTAKLYHPPCSLCGEQGRTERRLRKHNFRTNENETAQRYPLCEYCLNRVRSTCDFLGFLRMVKDGHWRTEGAQAESMAWEESVRLRERMFWARIGGGVVPAFTRNKADSPRSSTEEAKQAQTFPGSQTSLSSQDNKPDQPSPLGQKVELGSPIPPEQDILQRSEAVVSPKDYPRAESQTPPPPASPPSPSAAQPEASPPPASEPESRESDNSIMPRGIAETSGGPETRQLNGNTLTLTKTATCSRGSSRTEPERTEPERNELSRPQATRSEASSKAINSIARRAAMFERTASEDAASKQLQASLQASMKTRSPNGRKEAGASIPGSFDF